MKDPIMVQASVDAPVEKVWEYWTEPKHIVNWNTASESWHTPSATNDLRVGGKFTARMEAKDGSVGFDFEGEYTAVELNKKIEYAMSDGRKVSVEFITQDGVCRVIEKFDAEEINSADVQRDGWQAILNNFKKYVESQ